MRTRAYSACGHPNQTTHPTPPQLTQHLAHPRTRRQTCPSTLAKATSGSVTWAIMAAKTFADANAARSAHRTRCESHPCAQRLRAGAAKKLWSWMLLQLLLLPGGLPKTAWQRPLHPLKAAAAAAGSCCCCAPLKRHDCLATPSQLSEDGVLGLGQGGPSTPPSRRMNEAGGGIACATFGAPPGAARASAARAARFSNATADTDAALGAASFGVGAACPLLKHQLAFVATAPPSPPLFDQTDPLVPRAACAGGGGGGGGGGGSASSCLSCMRPCKFVRGFLRGMGVREGASSEFRESWWAGAFGPGTRVSSTGKRESAERRSRRRRRTRTRTRWCERERSERASSSCRRWDRSRAGCASSSCRRNSWDRSRGGCLARSLELARMVPAERCLACCEGDAASHAASRSAARSCLSLKRLLRRCSPLRCRSCALIACSSNAKAAFWLPETCCVIAPDTSFQTRPIKSTSRSRCLPRSSTSFIACIPNCESWFNMALPEGPSPKLLLAPPNVARGCGIGILPTGANSKPRSSSWDCVRGTSSASETSWSALPSEEWRAWRGLDALGMINDVQRHEEPATETLSQEPKWLRREA